MTPREVITTEGDGKGLTLTRNGFSYAAIPLRVLLLTYDEYRARGFNLDDSYPMRPIPADAGKSQCHTLNFCLYTILLVQAYPSCCGKLVLNKVYQIPVMIHTNSNSKSV